METRIQLSVMMFIEFFIWGAWFVTMGNYLSKIGFSEANIGLAYTATAWAAIISPFFVGMVADRFFSAEKVLGIVHLMGACLLFWAATITEPQMFFMVLLGYAICYMPTLALTNTIAFNQMTNPEKEFPPIRVLGTLGWIVAGLLLTLLGRISIPDIEATAKFRDPPHHPKYRSHFVPAEIGGGRVYPDGPLLVLLTSHATQGRGQEGHRRRDHRSGCPQADEESLVYGLRDWLASGLHPVVLLLCVRQHVSQ
jgi:hypothetical protein